MEFDDYEVNSYYHLNRLPNSAGVAVAHKTIKDGDRKWTLLAVMPMSACYRDEWYGNFDVGLGDGSETACMRASRPAATRACAL